LHPLILHLFFFPSKFIPAASRGVFFGPFDKMWKWAKPEGGILWYDFIYNNPRNPDVRGVPLSKIKELFPEGKVYSKKITLAPPIARIVTRFHPSLYTLLNSCILFRTHVICIIKKVL